MITEGKEGRGRGKANAETGKQENERSSRKIKGEGEYGGRKCREG